jgi:hypothetical protein
LKSINRAIQESIPIGSETTLSVDMELNSSSRVGARAAGFPSKNFGHEPDLTYRAFSTVTNEVALHPLRGSIPIIASTIVLSL